jgi:hypothetical protein
MASKDETKNCEKCGEEFSRRRKSGTLISPSNWKNRKYCSQKCMRESNRITLRGSR